MNAFLSPGTDKKKGSDPEIKLITHPQEHVVIPIGSFVLLHCRANYTAKQIAPAFIGNDYDELLPSEDDFMQNDDPNQEAINSKFQNPCAQEVQYQWLRNDKPVVSNSSFIKTFCNGTIQIQHSPDATASYRCVANTSEVDAVVSKASNVKIAGELIWQTITKCTTKFINI